MASAKVLLSDDFTAKIKNLGKEFERVAKKAVYAGAEIIADQVKQNMQGLPEDEFRRLKEGEQFKGVPIQQKNELIKSFGITRMSYDKYGVFHAKLGFDGYGKYKSNKYPKGLPNDLLARSIESGSSVRSKTPFFRKAVAAKKAEAQRRMEEIINEEFNKITKG